MNQEWKNEIRKAAKSAKEEKKAVKAIHKAMSLAGMEDFQEFRDSMNIAMEKQGFTSEREFLKIWTVQYKQLKSLFETG